MPEGFELNSWYDLSPMRPDEFAATNAWRWHEALTLRMAYQRGYEDARSEGATMQQLMSMEMQA